jgi:molybdate transport system ATP-binding protein
VLVTHDVLDAVTLADHVVVLADGRVAEVGPTAAVLSAPRGVRGPTGRAEPGG